MPRESKTRYCKPCRTIVLREQQYNLLATESDWLFRRQSGKCPICGRPLRPGKGTVVDHDHGTGQVRGLLCATCNMALGLLGDSSTQIDRAATYLRSWEFAQGHVKESV